MNRFHSWSILRPKRQYISRKKTKTGRKRGLTKEEKKERVKIYRERAMRKRGETALNKWEMYGLEDDLYNKYNIPDINMEELDHSKILGELKDIQLDKIEGRKINKFLISHHKTNKRREYEKERRAEAKSRWLKKRKKRNWSKKKIYSKRQTVANQRLRGPSGLFITKKEEEDLKDAYSMIGGKRRKKRTRKKKGGCWPFCNDNNNSKKKKQKTTVPAVLLRLDGETPIRNVEISKTKSGTKKKHPEGSQDTPTSSRRISNVERRRSSKYTKRWKKDLVELLDKYTQIRNEWRVFITQRKSEVIIENAEDLMYRINNILTDIKVKIKPFTEARVLRDINNILFEGGRMIKQMQKMIWYAEQIESQYADNWRDINGGKRRKKRTRKKRGGRKTQSRKTIKKN